MMLLIIFLLFGQLELIPSHDLAMAIFRVTPIERGLEVTINFDLEDYALANNLEMAAIDNYQLQEYLDCNTNWIINGKQEALFVYAIGDLGHDGHIQVSCVIDLADNELKQLELRNEFLLDIEEQTNVVLLKLEGDTRGFRMHRDRITITVDFQ